MDLNVFCNKCDEELHAEIVYGTMRVTPCENCTDKKDIENVKMKEKIEKIKEVIDEPLSQI